MNPESGPLGMLLGRPLLPRAGGLGKSAGSGQRHGPRLGPRCPPGQPHGGPELKVGPGAGGWAPAPAWEARGQWPGGPRCPPPRQDWGGCAWGPLPAGRPRSVSLLPPVLALIYNIHLSWLALPHVSPYCILQLRSRRQSSITSLLSANGVGACLPGSSLQESRERLRNGAMGD